MAVSQGGATLWTSRTGDLLGAIQAAIDRGREDVGDVTTPS
jgi:hypothetical protein